MSITRTPVTNVVPPRRSSPPSSDVPLKTLWQHRSRLASSVVTCREPILRAGSEHSSTETSSRGGRRLVKKRFQDREGEAPAEPKPRENTAQQELRPPEFRVRNAFSRLSRDRANTMSWMDCHLRLSSLVAHVPSHTSYTVGSCDQCRLGASTEPFILQRLAPAI